MTRKSKFVLWLTVCTINVVLAVVVFFIADGVLRIVLMTSLVLTAITTGQRAVWERTHYGKAQPSEGRD